MLMQSSLRVASWPAFVFASLRLRLACSLVTLLLVTVLPGGSNEEHKSIRGPINCVVISRVLDLLRLLW